MILFMTVRRAGSDPGLFSICEAGENTAAGQLQTRVQYSTGKVDKQVFFDIGRTAAPHRQIPGLNAIICLL